MPSVRYVGMCCNRETVVCNVLAAEMLKEGKYLQIMEEYNH